MMAVPTDGMYDPGTPTLPLPIHSVLSLILLVETSFLLIPDKGTEGKDETMRQVSKQHPYPKA